MSNLRNLLLGSLLLPASMLAADFATNFQDSTLRLDYIFAGKGEQASVSLHGSSFTPTWYGRRGNLEKLPLRGNGRIYVTDKATGDTLYANCFSTLYHEWLETPEAETTPRAFEHTMLVPMPKREAEIILDMSDFHQKNLVTIKHPFNPQDILVRDNSKRPALNYHVLHQGSAEKPIYVAMLPEGYTAEEMPRFLEKANEATEAILAHSPFSKYKDAFCFIAVEMPSDNSGVSVPHNGDWRQSAFGSHFSTFYSNRYLTTPSMFAVHDALTNVPYEHVIILANTDEYGGGGFFNTYVQTTTENPKFRPVVVHEFGHSFGGLADEYFYENDHSTDSYDVSIEPWESNATALKNFTGKWENLIPEGTPIPTPLEEADKYPVGVFEGCAYSSKGLYRASENCRMRTNAHPDFCPACQKGLEDLIIFYTE